jgi:hypothetical protein
LPILLAPLLVAIACVWLLRGQGLFKCWWWWLPELRLRLLLCLRGWGYEWPHQALLWRLLLSGRCVGSQNAIVRRSSRHGLNRSVLLLLRRRRRQRRRRQACSISWLQLLLLLLWLGCEVVGAVIRLVQQLLMVWRCSCGDSSNCCQHSSLIRLIPDWLLVVQVLGLLLLLVCVFVQADYTKTLLF